MRWDVLGSDGPVAPVARCLALGLAGLSNAIVKSTELSIKFSWIFIQLSLSVDHEKKWFTWTILLYAHSSLLFYIHFRAGGKVCQTAPRSRAQNGAQPSHSDAWRCTRHKAPRHQERCHRNDPLPRIRQ